MKNSYTKAALLLLCILTNQIITNGQTVLSGTTVDPQNAPVAYATVTLLNPADTSVLQGAISDSTGLWYFNVKKNDLPQYQIRVVAVGYQRHQSAPFTIKIGDKTELPPIVLTESTALSGVTVTAQKPFVTRAIDRLIINPDALIGNAGLTAFDLLARSPGVQADANQNLTMRGKSGVMIFIDDKPTYLPASELANYLSGLPASSIASIEIMTTPPARYDAAGNAGVINIRIKKTTVTGLNGAIIMSYGQGVYARTNNSANANYRRNKLNVYGNLGFVDINSFQDLVIERTYLEENSPEVQSVFRQNSFINIKRKSLTGRVGVDYYATDKTVLSLVVSGFDNLNIKGIKNDATVKNGAGALESTVKATNSDYKQWGNGSGAFNIAHNIGDKGKKVTFSTDYLRYFADNSSDLRNSVFTAAGDLIVRDNLVGEFPASIDINTAQVDYEQPWHDGQFSAGAKTSLIRTDNTANFFDRQPDGTQTVNFDLTNQFKYDENINAAYLSYNRNWNRFGLQAGLRLENTQIEGNQLGNALRPDSTFERQYTNLFPTLYGSYQCDTSGIHQLGLSYGYRIERPDYQSLNPFAYPLDKFTIYSGNPFLRPVFSHNIEFSHTYKSWLTTTLFYNFTKDEIQETIESENSIFYSRPGNVGQIAIWGANTNLSYPLRKWCTIQLYADLNYILANGTLYGQTFDTEGVLGNVNSTLQFVISPTWNAEVSSTYRSRVTVGQFATWPQKMINCTVQHKMFKNKASIRLAVNDVFYIFRTGGDLSALANSTALYYSRLDTRVATVTVSYRFNQGQIRQARQNNASEEERKRVKAG
jgi:iron complex outermembrane recepter protein